MDDDGAVICQQPGSPASGGSRAAQEMNFEVLAFGLAPEFANQWERLTTDREVAAVVLDASHFLE